MHMVDCQNAQDLVAALQNLQKSWALPISTPVTSMSSHDQYLFAAVRSGQLHLYNMSQVSDGSAPELVATALLARAARCIATGQAAVFIANGGCAIQCHPWTPTAGVDAEPSLALCGHSRAVTALAARDGLVYSAANDMSVRLWDQMSGQLIAHLAQDIEPPSSMAALGSSVLTASHASGGSLALWRYSLVQARAREWCALPPMLRGALALGDSSGAHSSNSELRCVHTFVEAPSRIHVVALHPVAAAALSASLTGEVAVWDTQSRSKAGEWRHDRFGHEAPLSAVALLPGVVCTASLDGVLRAAHCPVPTAAQRREEAGSAFLFGDDAPPFGSSAEEILRGVDAAAEELQRPFAAA